MGFEEGWGVLMRVMAGTATENISFVDLRSTILLIDACAAALKPSLEQRPPILPGSPRKA